MLIVLRGNYIMRETRQYILGFQLQKRSWLSFTRQFLSVDVKIEAVQVFPIWGLIWEREINNSE